MVGYRFYRFCQVAGIVLWSMFVGTGESVAKQAIPIAPVPVALRVQFGHSASVNDAIFSSDSRYILTASEDRTVRLWEVGTGRDIHSFEGHDGPVLSAEFSADGHYVVTVSLDRTARLWEVGTGQEIHRLELTGDLNSAHFSPDGRYVLTDSEEDTVRIWETSTGREIGRLEGHGGSVNSTHFSADGRYVLTASEDHTARIWETTTGREIGRLEGHGASVNSAHFSADGRYILTASDDGTARLWITATGRELRRFNKHGSSFKSAIISPDGHYVLTNNRELVCLWDLVTGQELRLFEGHDDLVGSAVFSADGHLVLTASWDQTARLWSTATGREVRRLEGHDGAVFSAEFSADDRYVLTASEDRTARLWETTTGREIRRFEGYGVGVDFSSFSADERNIVTVAGEVVGVWEVASGQEVRRIESDNGRISRASLSSDGHHLLTTFWSKRIAQLWDASTGAALRRYEGHSDTVLSAVFSPEGRYVLTASLDRTARLWDTATGRELRIFSGHDHGVNSASFSQDGQSVVTGSGDGTARLWDAATGREVRRLEGHDGAIFSAEFSADGRYVLTASEDHTARLWETTTGREIRRFEGHDDWVVSAVFSVDGRHVLTASWDQTARLWDTATGRELRRYQGHSQQINSAVFSLNGKYVITASKDGTSRVWDTRTGEELARLVSFVDGTWAVIDNAGQFDAVNGGEVAHLFWVSELESISLDQLKARYYEPGLLAKKLGANHEVGHNIQGFAQVALYPKISINSPSTEDPVLRIFVANRGGGIGKVAVSINGKEMAEDVRPSAIPPNVESLSLELPLSQYSKWLKQGQKNHIEVQAYNYEGYLKSRAAEALYDPRGEVEPLTSPHITLWAIIVGISDYAGAEKLDLRYSAKDAEDMAKAIRFGAHRLFGADHVKVALLTTNTDDPTSLPNKANIEAAFGRLGKAGPNDIIFVYLSGHGLSVSDSYYFLTREAKSTNLEDPLLRRQHAVSSEELAQWIKNAPATERQVIILDTCAAGAVSKSLVEARSVPADQIRALDRLKDRTGVYVLMGSAADRVSYEATQFEQGLLTHALLRGMKGAALREDAFIDVGRLFNYVADEVPRLALSIGGIQRPHIASPRSSWIESFDIGKLTSEDRAAIPLHNPKPLLLRPTLMNERKAYDDLGLQAKLRTLLRDASFAREHGSELPVAFVEADDLPGAIKPSGLYTVIGDKLRAKIILEKDNMVKELWIEGTSTSLDTFVENAMHMITKVGGDWSAPWRQSSDSR
ncbi:hypothetical protein YTPLAS18_33200 [Nitrospira sp.]|nr:hypothetical protein YTPLAS18_33200 [Nitrospira sp.]